MRGHQRLKAPGRIQDEASGNLKAEVREVARELLPAHRLDADAERGDAPDQAGGRLQARVVPGDQQVVDPAPAELHRAIGQLVVDLGAGQQQPYHFRLGAAEQGAGVAAGGFGGDGALVVDRHVEPARRQLVGQSAARDPGTDDDGVGRPFAPDSHRHILRRVGRRFTVASGAAGP